MKHVQLRLPSALVFVLLALSGCALLDALDAYHYIGIYEDSYKDEALSRAERAGKFDQLLAAIGSTTGYATEIIVRDAHTKTAWLVIPKEKQSSLNRVVVGENVTGGISISIIKISAGENEEVVSLKRNLEKAFLMVHLTKWKFYIQHTHGQIFNS